MPPIAHSARSTDACFHVQRRQRGHAAGEQGHTTARARYCRVTTHRAVRGPLDGDNISTKNTACIRHCGYVAPQLYHNLPKTAASTKSRAFFEELSCPCPSARAAASAPAAMAPAAMAPWLRLRGLHTLPRRDGVVMERAKRRLADVQRPLQPDERVVGPPQLVVSTDRRVPSAVRCVRHPRSRRRL
jgi:hypothetical protein